MTILLLSINCYKGVWWITGNIDQLFAFLVHYLYRARYLWWSIERTASYIFLCMRTVRTPTKGCNLNKSCRSYPILRIIGQVFISCCNSLEPPGPVKDVTLDTWLVHRSACSTLRNIPQQSCTQCILVTPHFTDPDGMESWVEIVCSGDWARTSCTQEWTCVGAANDLSNWAIAIQKNDGPRMDPNGLWRFALSSRCAIQ